MTETTVHVFFGLFGGMKNAYLYTQEQWIPEPKDSVSEEEYANWENNNPSWKMKNDICEYLDSDFIETIEANGCSDYLKTMIESSDVDVIIKQIGTAPNDTLVLIFKEALGGFNQVMKSTEKL